jgi:hypothetical protein
MQLIPISENTLVNPEAISYVQKRTVGNSIKLTVNVGGKTLTMTVPFEDFHKDLINAGVDTQDQFFKI